ncbi:GNAT family N-acetyltransferase [Sandarakinorhabdus sp.]|uniref:GNAT family N-acetyltransferase n=1 Tax=Sandarakinorhabdus sp. TaxID=1916663 RepID=UPI0033423473
MADIHIRPALPGDVPALEALIAASARMLSTGFYTAQQTEAAIAHVFGVDSELVCDGSYLVVEASDSTADILGCGGWSRRATLFGGDRYGGRESGLLDPARDAAKVRAFFVAQHAARRGVGAALLHACETAAAAAGFARTELMATLPGVPFYAAHGYSAGDPISLNCGGVAVPFVPMHKQLLIPETAR